MSKNKYLVLLRRQPSDRSRPEPSPEQMQQMFAAYKAWKEKFQDAIVDMGDQLVSGGRVVTADGVTDGPFVEAKEVIGGFMILTADDYDGAVEVVAAMPGTQMPGVSLEVRELAGRTM